ncbi:Hypothetical protein, putative [Bodo saltans]|uniref:RING-type domain-containing protein n=1 Tax=Bodo saltans TaxID=75058 RepID=A0A0S4JKA9_BODSA|nr:Hypothetical protein, putative [Bodo saltans]|eukprot:CUG89406.1 Hypothetical protein, putative [Bodo saltans]
MDSDDELDQLVASALNGSKPAATVASSSSGAPPVADEDSDDELLAQILAGKGVQPSAAQANRAAAAVKDAADRAAREAADKATTDRAAVAKQAAVTAREAADRAMKEAASRAAAAKEAVAKATAAKEAAERTAKDAADRAAAERTATADRAAKDAANKAANDAADRAAADKAAKDAADRAAADKAAKDAADRAAADKAAKDAADRAAADRAAKEAADRVAKDTADRAAAGDAAKRAIVELDESSDDEELLQRVLKGAPSTNSAAPNTASPPARGPAAATPPRTPSPGTTDPKLLRDESDLFGTTTTSSLFMDAFLKKHTKTPTAAEQEHEMYAMEDEEEVLQAILGALSDVGDVASGSPNSTADASAYQDVDAILDHAERVATSTTAGKHGSSSVLHTHESHGLRDELQRARASAGLPISIDTYYRPEASGTLPVVAVGTSLGVVLLMNHKHTICGVCGSIANQGSSESKGSAVSLRFNITGDMVVCGYERGQIVLWDVNTLQAIRTLTDEFESPVTRICTSNVDKNRFIALDGEGVLKTFLVSRVIGKAVLRSSTLSFDDLDSPFRDAALTCILPPPRTAGVNDNGRSDKGGVLEPMHLAAAVSGEHVVVFNGESGDALYHSRAAATSMGSSSNSLVQWVVSGDRKLVVVSWGAVVDVLQVVSLDEGSSTELACVTTATIRASRPLLSAAPLDGACLFFLDQEDRAHVFDAIAAKFVENIRLISFDTVSYSSRRSGLCYHGAVTQNRHGLVTLLGKQKVLHCNVLSWDVRLDALITTKRFDEAFELARDFSLDVAVATVGLSDDAATRKRSVQDHIVQLITAKLSDSVKRRATPQEFRVTVRAIVSFCASIECMETVFFGPILAFLTQLQLRDVVLLDLEWALRTGAIHTLPDALITDMAELFLHPVRLAEVNDPTSTFAAAPAKERLELLLMCIEGGYDILTELATREGLPRLTCTILSFRRHLYTQALDYAVKNNANDVAVEFLAATLAGDTLIPGKPLQVSFQRHAKQQLLVHLIKQPKQILAPLLRWDVDAMLRALGNALADNSFASPWSVAAASGVVSTPTTPQSATTSSPSSSGAPAVSKALLMEGYYQCLVDDSLAPTRPWEAERREWPPYKTYVDFLCRVGSELTRGTVAESAMLTAASVGERILFACIYLFHKSATSAPTTSASSAAGAAANTVAIAAGAALRQELQASLIHLISSSSGILKGVNLSLLENELLSKNLGRTLAFFRAFVRFDFIGAIDCFLNHDLQREDATLATSVFPFILECMESFQRRGEGKHVESLRLAVKRRLQLLVEVDPTSLAQFVFDHLPGDHSEVLSALRGSAETFLRYLKELIGKGGSSVDTDPFIQNNYIELLSIYEPDAVYPYLHARDASITYDLQAALEAVRSHRVVDATIFLLEKTVMIDEAMDILMESVTHHLNVLRTALIRELVTSQDFHGMEAFKRPEPSLNVNDFTMTNTQSMEVISVVQLPTEEMDAVQRMVNVGVDLCTRHHSRGSSQAARNWFRLLDRFTKPKRILFDRQVADRSLRITVDVQPADGFDDNEIEMADKLLTRQNARQHQHQVILQQPLSFVGCLFVEKMQDIYTSFTSHILTHMITVLDLAVVVGKIVDDNERERFGPFKPIIVNILESLSFELEVNRLCKLCTDGDTLKLGRDLFKLRSHGLKPASDSCGVCRVQLSEVVEELDTVRFFACGHGYHEHCASGLHECLVCATRQYQSQEEVFVAEQEALLQQQAAKKTKKGGSGGAKNAAPASPPTEQHKDINMIVRRLKLTRNKLDGGRNYCEMLQTYLNQPAETATTSSNTATSRRKTLLLAPTPPPPVSIGQIRVGKVKTTDVVGSGSGLSEEEITQLFGEAAVELMGGGHGGDNDEGGLTHGNASAGDDDEDFDLDAALALAEED